MDVYNLYNDEQIYLLSLEELSKIPVGTRLLYYSLIMDEEHKIVEKPAQHDIAEFSFKDKKYTKYGWTRTLAKEQGFEDLFIFWLLGV